MNDKVLMTAVITTFNNEKTITATLNSILKQKLPVKQLVIVDDNSADNTINKIKKTFKKEISKGIIHLIINKKNHGGPAYGRNVGIRKALGKYIFFCDGDDIWDNRLTFNYENILKQNNFDIISCDRFFFRDSSEINFKDCGKIKKIYLSRFDFISNPVCTSSVAGKTKIFKRFMFDEKKYLRGIEDYDCFLRMKEKGIKFCKLKNKFLFYRKANNSLSANKLLILKKLFFMFKNKYIIRKNHPRYIVNIFAFLRISFFLMHRFIRKILNFIIYR